MAKLRCNWRPVQTAATRLQLKIVQILVTLCAGLKLTQ